MCTNPSSQPHVTQYIQTDKRVLLKRDKFVLMLKNLCKFVTNTEAAVLQNQHVLTQGAGKRKNYTDHNLFINNVQSLCLNLDFLSRQKHPQLSYFPKPEQSVKVFPLPSKCQLIPRSLTFTAIATASKGCCNTAQVKAAAIQHRYTTH